MFFRKGTCSASECQGGCKGTRVKCHGVSAQQGSFIWNLDWTKAGPTPTKHPLRKHRKHRKLSKAIFWLAKLHSPSAEKWKGHSNTCSRLIRFSLVLFLYFSCQHLLNSFSSIDPSSVVLSSLCSHSLHTPPPRCCWGLWFQHWPPDSALCSHLTQTQRSRVGKCKALLCVHTPHKAPSGGHCVVTPLDRVTLGSLSVAVV